MSFLYTSLDDYHIAVVVNDENKLVWQSWAVGVRSGMRDVESYNGGRPSNRSLRSYLNYIAVGETTHVYELIYTTP
jgi:hypothetical protein